MDSTTKLTAILAGILAIMLILFAVISVSLNNKEREQQPIDQINEENTSLETQDPKESFFEVGNIKEIRLPKQEFAYVINEDSDDVSVINMNQRKVVGTIEVGEGPQEAYMYDKKIFVANTLGKSISIIDTITDTVIETIKVEFEPKDIIVVDNFIYATDEKNSVHTININSKIQGGITTHNQPSLMAFDEGNKLLYVSASLDGKVSVIDTKINGVIENIQVGKFPQGIAVQSTGEYVYVLNKEENTLSIISTEKKEEIKDFFIGVEPRKVIFNSGGNFAYVSVITSEVIMVGAKKEDIVFTFDMPAGTYGLALDAKEKNLVVTHPKTNRVSILNLENHKVTKEINVGNNPKDIIIIKK